MPTRSIILKLPLISFASQLTISSACSYLLALLQNQLQLVNHIVATQQWSAMQQSQWEQLTLQCNSHKYATDWKLWCNQWYLHENTWTALRHGRFSQCSVIKQYMHIHITQLSTNANYAKCHSATQGKKGVWGLRDAFKQVGLARTKTSPLIRCHEESFFGGQRSLMTVVIFSTGWRLHVW